MNLVASVFIKYELYIITTYSKLTNNTKQPLIIVARIDTEEEERSALNCFTVSG